MRRFQTLLFDADNTLLDFDACEKEALKLVFEQHQYPLNEEIYQLYKEMNIELWKLYELGKMDRHTVIYSRFGMLFKKIGIQDDGIAFEDDYQKLLGMQHFLMEDSLAVIAELQPEFDLYIVTNGVTVTQLQRFRESKLDTYMKKIFVSEETGYQKPMKEYFDYCFERIDGFERSKAMIIGDSLSSDMRGGNNAGITTCWYNPNRLENHTDVKVDYEIRHLNELKQLLDSTSI